MRDPGNDMLDANSPGQLTAEDDVAFYEQHGWYISPRVLSDAELDRAQAGIEAFYAGARDATLPVADGYSDWRPADGDGLRNNEFVSLQKREVLALIRVPAIGAIAARLARTRAIRLLDDQLVYKPGRQPGVEDTTVGWHADHAYWGTCSSNELLTAWIPFHDVDESNGTLVVLDGSHRWSGIEHSRHFNNRNLEEIEAHFRARGEKVKRVPLRLKRGQVSFHHCWTLHASLPNGSDSPRLALAAHLQDEANRYRAYRDPRGNPVQIFDERLCRRLPNGDPDFSDPDVFPTLWSEARDTSQRPAQS